MAALSLLAVVLAVVLRGRLSGRGGSSVGDDVFATVRRGPLVISLREAGEIQPSEQIKIKSEVEGRTTILSIVPEGTRVKAGDLLVELDTSSLEESRVNQEITVKNNEAAFIEARENLEVVKNQARADVELAELKYQFAQEDLEKYENGEYPNTLNEQMGAVTLAEEELERARDTLEWSRRLHAAKYLSDAELRSDELSWKSRELSLRTARGKLDLLQNYTHRRQMAQLRSDLSQAEMTLERTRRIANANIVQAEAKLRARELEFARQKDKLAKILDQIAKARIVAPMDGLVIYATTNQRWGNQDPIVEGKEVHEREDLIVLPTADTYVAEINIHENNLKKVEAGQSVVVRVDAVPDRVFSGRVTRISPLPDSMRMWANPDLKVYKTVLEIDGGGDVLKSGMNCHAEIVIAQYPSALFIPVQCVVRIGGEPTVWVRGRDGVAERRVEIGLDDNRVVHILSGLEEGEEVLMAPPLGDSAAPGALSTEAPQTSSPDGARAAGQSR